MLGSKVQWSSKILKIMQNTQSASGKKATEIALESYNICINTYQIQHITKIQMSLQRKTKVGDSQQSEGQI